VAADLVLLSPLAGWASALAEAPDPVFAEAMLGDGLAIDPTGDTLHAPCDAEVITVHASRHAVTLRAAGGLELLLHVGLETVALGGEGFETLVTPGQQVSAGAPLLRFDLDHLARHARSLVSPVVITETAGWRIAERTTGRLVAVGDPVIRLSAETRMTVAKSAAPSAAELTRRITVPLPHGLHARPAARVAACARQFAAETAITRAGRRASARSPMALMALGLQQDDEAVLSAAGSDAAAALEALAQLIQSGMGETSAAVPETSLPPPPPPATPAQAKVPGLLRGVAGAPGLAIGRATRLADRDLEVPTDGRGAAHEAQALAAARTEVRRAIEAALAGETDPVRGDILSAHLGLLDDSELSAEAARQIAEGRSAGFAWRAAIGGFAEAIGALADRRMAERVADLRDLERRVLAAILGEDAGGADVPAGAILVADDILPSQLMAIAPARLAGLCVSGGGPTSHVSILAAAMGLPALVALGPDLAAVADGTTVILDAEAATLQVAPDAQALEAAQAKLARRAQRHAAARAAAREVSRLADGAPLPVLANLGAVSDAPCAAEAGAEGAGLVRTEFLFLERERAPTEDEQAACYQAIADGLPDRPLVFRLLDIGGDKPAPYLPQPPEENPALGVRGVRLALRHPELLAAQLRALLRVAPAGRVAIMAPMIARLAELRAVRAALDAAVRDLGLPHGPPLGVMIETPAAAMTADLLAAEADFLSIGTNDLSQYVLAMDRGNPDLAGEVDALEPAVLRLIARTCEGGRMHGREVSVCGALAGDPAAIPILIGLGVGKLSMPPAAIAEAKALIRVLDPATCRALAARALDQPSAADVRALIKSTGG
jgi:phosphocarrier protein FPr/phosphocarrier protein